MNKVYVLLGAARRPGRRGRRRQLRPERQGTRPRPGGREPDAAEAAGDRSEPDPRVSSFPTRRTGCGSRGRARTGSFPRSSIRPRWRTRSPSSSRGCRGSSAPSASRSRPLSARDKILGLEPDVAEADQALRREQQAHRRPVGREDRRQRRPQPPAGREVRPRRGTGCGLLPRQAPAAPRDAAALDVARQPRLRARSQAARGVGRKSRARHDRVRRRAVHAGDSRHAARLRARGARPPGGGGQGARVASRLRAGGGHRPEGGADAASEGPGTTGLDDRRAGGVRASSRRRRWSRTWCAG